VVAKYHGIPFLVAAPTTTIDVRDSFVRRRYQRLRKRDGAQVFHVGRLGRGGKPASPSGGVIGDCGARYQDLEPVI
jgi:hypothetical protein